MYLNGHIVLQDKKAAVMYLQRAAEQNFGRAIKLLAKLETSDTLSRSVVLWQFFGPPS